MLTEFGMPHANQGSERALEIYQWSGELCLAGDAFQ